MSHPPRTHQLVLMLIGPKLAAHDGGLQVDAGLAEGVGHVDGVLVHLQKPPIGA